MKMVPKKFGTIQRAGEENNKMAIDSMPHARNTGYPGSQNKCPCVLTSVEYTPYNLSQFENPRRMQVQVSVKVEGHTLARQMKWKYSWSTHQLFLTYKHNSSSLYKLIPLLPGMHLQLCQ
ncbi:unnamed protein product [Allacma fusca]|uniref:Uncharacterized protein n=1 Tax=Allacma fusca TaxID=39272 RepID=A0A8J2LN90_9HEXA|nr:unnamed protein product [Allacma fusca]